MKIYPEVEARDETYRKQSLRQEPQPLGILVDLFCRSFKHHTHGRKRHFAASALTLSLLSSLLCSLLSSLPWALATNLARMRLPCSCSSPSVL